jgi:hypothetical protein
VVATPPDARHVGFARVQRLGETEVEDLDVVVARDHHVLGFEIAMHDAARVSGSNAPGDLKGVRDRPPNRQCAAFEADAQCLAVHEFGDDERGIAVLHELEDGEYVGMRQLRDTHRLVLEPRESARIHRKLRGENLDGHLAIEPRIARAIDFAHPPAPMAAMIS